MLTLSKTTLSFLVLLGALVLALLRLQPAYGAFGVSWRVNGICTAVIAASNHRKSDAEILAVFEQTFFHEVPAFRPTHLAHREFRAIALSAVKKQVATGRASLMAMHGVSQVAEAYWHPEITPSDFEAELSRAEELSRPLTRRSAPGTHEIPWGEIPLNPNSTLLKKTVEIFRNSKLKVYAASLDFMARSQISFLTRGINLAVAAGLVKAQNPEVTEAAVSVFSAAIERYSVYDTQSNPKGILLASAFVHATPSENLLEQMAACASDVTWDLESLLLYFDANLRAPHSRSSKLAEHIFNMKRAQFLGDTIDPDYRQKIYDRGNERAFSSYDWTYFFDLFTLLQRVDSYRQAVLLGQENQRKAALRMTDAEIVRNVFNIQHQKFGAVSEIVEPFSQDPSEIIRLIDRLNGQRRP